MDDIAQIVHVTTRAKSASPEEKSLAWRLSKARKAGTLTREQEAVLGNHSQLASNAEEILQQGRDLGCCPKEGVGHSLAARQLVEMPGAVASLST